MFRVVVCVLALLMAGCAQEVETPQEATCEDDSCKAVVEEQTSEVGSIRGVTVDETINPIANATVKLLNGPNGEVEVRSGANGAFAFEGIPPGFYFVSGALKGFEESQTQVEVVAGEIARTKILLSREPVPPMFAPTIQFDGLLGCSWHTPVGRVQVCSIVGGITGPPFSDNSYRDFQEDVDALGVPQFIQFEVYWESTQATGDGLTLTIRSNEPTDRNFGGSPLVRNYEQERIDARSWGDGGAIRVQLWAGPDDGIPFGMTFQQDFQLFVTPFYGFLPDEGWMFVRDGQAEPPGE